MKSIKLLMCEELFTEDDVQRYLFLLDQTFNEDNKIRNDSEAEINENTSINILKSVLIFSEIILRDDIQHPIVHMCFVWIKKIFTPIPPISEDQISQKWLSFNESFRNKLKIAIFRGFMFPDPRIISVASLSLAALLNIEKQHMFDLIPRLFELVESPEYSDLAHAAGISALAEICGPQSLGGHTQFQEVQEIIGNIFMHVGGYF